VQHLSAKVGKFFRGTDFGIPSTQNGILLEESGSDLDVLEGWGSPDKDRIEKDP
jgi:hypothetical protein